MKVKLSGGPVDGQYADIELPLSPYLLVPIIPPRFSEEVRNALYRRVKLDYEFECMDPPE